MNKKFVLPGEKIAVIEEFFPSLNTFKIDGDIFAKLAGFINISFKSRKISVIPISPIKPLIPRYNDIVYGIVSRVKEVIATVNIFEIEGKGILSNPFSGLLYVSYVSSYYIKDLFEAIRTGDIIRARIISKNRIPFILSIKGRDNGVIYARCPYCMRALKKRGLNLFCSGCRKTSNRKISSFYLL